MVVEEGASKSVGSTGSQTTYTRILGSRRSSNNFSNAETPRRQVGQVGDSSKSTRMEFLDWLNPAFKASTFE